MDPDLRSQGNVGVWPTLSLRTKDPSMGLRNRSAIRWLGEKEKGGGRCRQAKRPAWKSKKDSLHSLQIEKKAEPAHVVGARSRMHTYQIASVVG